MIRKFRTGDQTLEAFVRHLDPTTIEVGKDGETRALPYERMGRLLIFEGNTRRYFTRAVRDKDKVYVWIDGRVHELVELEDVNAADNLVRNRDEIRSPMPGTILKLSVGAGDDVAEDQIVAVLEAMKMEHNLRAPRAGRVDSVDVVIGQTVSSEALLIRLVRDE